MRLESPAFRDGEPIPKKYSEDGGNLSPPLRWADVPKGIAEFTLLVEDPDAPTNEPWVHWVLHGIPGDKRELREGLPRQGVITVDGSTMFQGLNTWPQNNIGYRGPAPPRGHGVHHYHFRLFALKGPLQLGERITKEALLRAMQGKVLADTDLVGTYQR